MYVFQDLNATIFSQIYQLVKEPPLNYWGRGSLSAELYFFTLGLKQNIYFTLKKIHKLEGSLNYAEQSEVQFFHKEMEVQSMIITFRTKSEKSL